MEARDISDLFRDWYTDIKGNPADDRNVKKQIIHIEYLIKELKAESQNPKCLSLKQKIKEEKEEIKKLEKRLQQISGPDKLVITGVEFIKTSYHQFIEQRTCMEAIKTTLERRDILQKCYQFCDEEAKAQMKELTRAYGCSTEKISELRLSSAFQALQGLTKKCSAKLKLHRRGTPSSPEQFELIREYIRQCVEISWIIVIQTPPFKLNFDTSIKDVNNKTTFHNAFRCDEQGKTVTGSKSASHNARSDDEQEKMATGSKSASHGHNAQKDDEQQKTTTEYEVVYPALMQEQKIIIYGIKQPIEIRKNK